MNLSRLKGMFGKAENLAVKHADQVEGGLEKAGRAVKGKVDPRHAGKVDTAIDKAGDLLGKLKDDRRRRR